MRFRSAVLAILWGGAGAAAVASTSPLREIDHIAITDDVCANVVVHANSAIAATLRGDERLTRAVARMRGSDFDDASPGKRSAMAEIARLAAEVNDAANRGGSEVKRLLALADAAPRDHATDLHVFARALGTTLERQAKMGGELDNFVAALDVREIKAASNGGIPSGFEPVDGASHGIGRSIAAPPPVPSFAQRPLMPVAMARSVASELTGRMEANVRDETRAAERAEAAVTGC